MMVQPDLPAATLLPTEPAPFVLDHPIVWVVILLICLRLLMQTWLKQLNFRYVKARAEKVPEPLQGVMDEATYAKSVEYTIARGRLAGFDDGYSALMLLVVLFSGLLPWAFRFFQQHVGTTTWAMAAFLFVAGVA